MKINQFMQYFIAWSSVLILSDSIAGRDINGVAIVIASSVIALMCVYYDKVMYGHAIYRDVKGWGNWLAICLPMSIIFNLIHL